MQQQETCVGCGVYLGTPASRSNSDNSKCAMCEIEAYGPLAGVTVENMPKDTYLKAISANGKSCVVYARCDAKHVGYYVLLSDTRDDMVCLTCSASSETACPLRETRLEELRAFFHHNKKVVFAEDFVEGGCALEYLPLMGFSNIASGGGMHIFVSGNNPAGNPLQKEEEEGGGPRKIRRARFVRRGICVPLDARFDADIALARERGETQVLTQFEPNDAQIAKYNMRRDAASGSWIIPVPPALSSSP